MYLVNNRSKDLAKLLEPVRCCRRRMKNLGTEVICIMIEPKEKEMWVYKDSEPKYLEWRNNCVRALYVD